MWGEIQNLKKEKTNSNKVTRFEVSVYSRRSSAFPLEIFFSFPYRSSRAITREMITRRVCARRICIIRA